MNSGQSIKKQSNKARGDFVEANTKPTNRAATKQEPSSMVGPDGKPLARMSKHEIIWVNPELLYSGSFDVRSNTTAINKKQINLLTE